jgi:CopG family nickel-responsive transcriptional regulator
MIERFSVSIEQRLMKAFGGFMKKKKYGTRSEAVRDLIRKALVQEEWKHNVEVVGVISLVFDHHQRQLQERITEVQHDYHHQIVSTTHIHLDHDNCLEVIIAKGKASRVKSLADRLTALRGVKNGALSAASTGEKLH